MKKTLAILFGTLAVIAAILFTPPGRSLVLIPLANAYLHHTLPNHRVELDSLKPRLNTLQLSGTVDKTIRFEAAGPVRWIPLSFDLGYRVNAKEVSIGTERYPVKLDLQGRLKGKPADMTVTGAGRGFDASLHYALEMREGKVLGLKADAKGARVDQLLAFAGKPPYATGMLDLKAEIPSIDATVQKGGIDFKVNEGRIDARLLKKDFGIQLPPVRKYTLQGRLRLAGKLLKGEAALHSGLIDLSLKNFRSDRKLKIFKSDYRLEIPELSRLKPLTHTALYGPWKMAGTLYLDRGKELLQLTGVSPSLEGKTRFFYDNGALELSLKQVGIPSLLALAGEPPLARSGKIDATARFQDLKKLEGRYTLLAKGRWNREELLKLVGTDPGKALDFTLQSQGRLHKSLLQASADYRSPLLDLVLSDLKYEWISGAMEGKYRLIFPDLRRLKLFAKARGSYRADLKGEMSYLPVKKLLRVEGETVSFGGRIHWRYSGASLELTLKNTDGRKLSSLAGLPPLWKKATLNGKLNLKDIARKSGDYTLNLKALADPKALKKLCGIRLGRPLSLKVRSDGHFLGSELTLQSDLESGWGVLKLRKGRYLFDSGRFRSLYALNIPDLSRLQPLTGRRYRGPLVVTGRLDWAGKLHVTGSGKEWGGRLDYVLDGDLLRIRTQGMEIARVMKALDISPLLTGKAQSDLRYNLQSERGNLKVESQGIRLVQSPLTQVASLLLKRDLSRELFSRVILTAQIEKRPILFDFHATSSRTRLEIKGGKIDRIQQSIDAVLKIDDHGHQYMIRIHGPLKHPAMTPIMTQALEHKIEKVIKNKKIRKKIDKVIKGGSPVGKFLQKLF
ncbi:hypothetical protein [Nitratifractor salsuginis]|uniref:AsmA-like C-terminal domain-containing protein n=1 Tax=Nitratifractor salsuginis (strain DSM 16511 / JCM 12458 / E9I37-1) TaxID=749222 RepID=E6X0J4_NITSE|nr:hypothetical protein [Nitratifractor salsuginis]ADV46844.1 hypothetical protein Nitsa_1596 [Nitratifractor salsuginis DSM 16511]